MLKRTELQTKWFVDFSHLVVVVGSMGSIFSIVSNDFVVFIQHDLKDKFIATAFSGFG